MKYSKNWLQEYIKENLPQDKTIEDVLNTKAFEVEGLEIIKYSETSKNGEIKEVQDTIFDIKVLPNRAHDALCHVGMAREVAACLDLTFSYPLSERGVGGVLSDESVEKVNIKILEDKSCTRFMAVRIDGVVVGESPVWLKNKLEAIGQRSINNIVDITNYVQYTLNKPMHAYDANNIAGGLKARYAAEGEVLVTLDDKELILNQSGTEKVLVISDDKKALGLAGIKGGKYSGINHGTTSIIIESANFDPVLIRKTSQKYNIKTDASKRFENGIADTLVESGLHMTISEILKLFPDAKVGEIGDTKLREYKNYKSGVTLDDANSILGSDISEQELENILNRLGFEYDKVNTTEKLKELIKIAIDKPYKRGASVMYDAPESFDCSSLTNYFYKESYGHIPRISIDQYVFSKAIKTEEARFGDLVFTNTNIIKTKDNNIFSQVLGKVVNDIGTRTESLEFMKGAKVEGGIDHVGFYIGNNQVLHANSTDGKVVLEDIDDSNAFKNSKLLRRPFENIKDFSYIVSIPHERLDLRTKEDLIEEVGRIYGYEKLVPILPDLKNKIQENKIGLINNRLNTQNIIRNILNKYDFSEVITYSLTEKGDIKLAKSASDKTKLRINISDGLLESLNKNLGNMPLLNLETVKMYEMGSVFILGKDTNKITEPLNLAIAIDDGKKKSHFQEEIKNILLEIEKKLNLEKIDFVVKSVKPYVIEISLDNIINQIENITTGENLGNNFLSLDNKKIENIKYKSFSQMPFVVRDVAFWCDVNTDKIEILGVIKDNAGELCVSVNIFDEFTKEIEIKKDSQENSVTEKKTMKSLGYRLVYQDNIRTLTDEEVNTYSDKVYEVLKNKGFEIR